jgi:flavin reductase (DIM6/NTAB) family NADH-FMN oxidoreductase RutF
MLSATRSHRTWLRCKPPPRRRISSPAPTDVAHQLRAVLRETAQQVAVVTSLLPGTTSNSLTRTFHGATLSSFTSIAMHPHPLITFSLRVPSRMATALKAAHRNAPNAFAHMVINVLSADQASTAIAFARPDLHPAPFASRPYSLTAEGIPVLGGSLGAFSCRMGGSWPLSDLDKLERGMSTGPDGGNITEEAGVCMASELFIARVTRVEEMRQPGDEERIQPLLYRRGEYATSCTLPEACGPELKS